MTGSNEREERMLVDTLGAFQDGSRAVTSPEHGLLLIEGWLLALQGNIGMERVEAKLTELRDALKHDTPDAEHIREIVLDLADQAHDIARGRNAEGTWTGKLESLSQALRNFSSEL